MKPFPPRIPTEARREQVVRAALHLLAHTSIEGLSTRRLAAELGLTQPALFRHFPRRDDLLLATIASARSDLEALAAKVLEGADTPVTSLATLGAALLAHVEEHPGLPRLLFAMGTPSAGPIRAALEHVVSMQTALVGELVREGQRRGDFDQAVDPDAAATLFVGMMQGIVLRWEIGARPRGLPARFAASFAIWRTGVSTPPARSPPSATTPTAASDPGPFATPRPTLAHLDVRPVLARGEDPLRIILTAIEALSGGAVLVVEAPFRPNPLLALLTGRGHGVFVEELAPNHWVVEIAVGGAVPIEDLRDLDPPEPLERVLTVTARQGPNEAFLARLPRHPSLLLPRLAERGLLFATVPRGDGSVLVRVESP